MKFLSILFGLMMVCSVGYANQLKVVSTIGQINDIVKNIGGDYVDPEGLMGPGVDPHLYKASQSDVRRLASADIIFYNGLHLEAKLTEVFEKMARSKTVVAVSQDMNENQLLDHEDYKNSFDPHIWFDLNLWQQAVSMIGKTLASKDQTNAAFYIKNANDFNGWIKKMDQYARDRITEIPEDQRVLVTAHDAFRYFGRAYGFEVVGLQGISTASEAGAKDVRELANLIVERKLKAIFIESSIPERNVRAVQDAVRARGWEVVIGGELYSDAMGSEGTEEGTFLGMFKHNIDTIVDALK